MIMPVDYTRTVLTEIPISLKCPSFWLTDFIGVTTEVNLTTIIHVTDTNQMYIIL